MWCWGGGRGRKRSSRLEPTLSLVLLPGPQAPAPQGNALEYSRFSLYDIWQTIVLLWKLFQLQAYKTLVSTLYKWPLTFFPKFIKRQQPKDFLATFKLETFFIFSFQSHSLLVKFSFLLRKIYYELFSRLPEAALSCLELPWAALAALSCLELPWAAQRGGT